MIKFRNLLTIRSGAFLTVLICLLLTWLYLSPVIQSLNTTLFSAGGDGLKSYYGYLYHIQHDPSALEFQGMNYPWGESVFFTDNQPYLSITMRWLCDIFPGLFDYSIAIWNALLLLSISLTALFLYVVLAELGMPVIVSLLGGIGIALLSPQIYRMGAHYSLSYGWVIPLAIYLLLKFSRKPSYKYSLAFFFLIIWSGASHQYYMAFIAMMIILFWIFFGFGRRRTYGSWRVWLPHLLIQLVIPFIIVELMVGMSTDVTDRASYPFGFLYYRAYPESVFLPADRFYGHFLQHIINYKYINWEGYAYVGLLASLGCLIFLGKSIARLVRNRFRSGLAYDNSLFLSYLFWSSFLILLYSFGIPFILGMENLIDYLGPIRQMRGIGRCAWVFYYSMNILVIYSLYQLFSRKKTSLFPKILMVLAFMVLLTEAHINIKGILPYLKNHNPEFTDLNNRMPVNDWVKRINPDEYQSIMTLPFFHIGSESLWIEAQCGIDKTAYYVSLKTGFPMNSVMMGRTSLSQTYKSVELSLEPYRNPEILNKMNPDKPFLILSAACDELDPVERNILAHSQKLEAIGDYTLSRIGPDSLKALHDSYIRSAIDRINPASSFDGKVFRMDTVTPVHWFNSYQNEKPTVGYQSSASLIIPHKASGVILNQTLEGFSLPDQITISFWIKGIRKDNMARVRLETISFGINGQCENYVRSEVGRWLKLLDDEWGLIELQVPAKPGERLQLTLTPELIKEDLVIDNLLIRRSGDDISGVEAGKGWWINNRFYPLESLK
ncbi:MAG: hypothetical protein V2A67_00715 [Bacteroidota bacterium]